MEQQLERRRRAVASQWGLTDEIVLIGAGEPITVPGRGDPTYPFYAHSEYFYLTDRNLPGGVLAFDPGEGWFDFVTPITEDDRLWSGAPAQAQQGLTTAALAEWLAARSARTTAWLGAAPPDARSGAALVEDLRAGLDRVRRPKDALELERMRIAALATRAAFAAAVPFLRDGATERERADRARDGGVPRGRRCDGVRHDHRQRDELRGAPFRPERSGPAQR